MELKVKAVEAVEEKSMQEVEKELLDKHEEKLIEEDKLSEETPQVKMDFAEDGSDKTVNEVKETSEEKPEPVQEPAELSEEDVLSYIGKRYGREINSLDELNAAREEAEELPEDVASYFKYKKETGRGIEDYVRLQKDFSAMNPDTLLREYLTITEGEGLDPEDIDSLMEDFSYDEELDDESVVKKTKLAKKKTIAKAKKFFNEQKELYKQPLESRPAADSQSNNEELQEYRQYLESAKTQQQESETKRNWFLKESDKVFTDDFKGFDFVLDDKTVTFSPGNAQTIKKNQETPMNFINKYLDDKGLISDAAGYHRALSIAMNPDKFAQFFYEQGKSEATEDVIRKTKNINMTERKTPEITNKGGFQVKSVNPDSGRGLKIRSIKRK
tara:strand:+ start:1328 stop:2485 length:1158 start_codon:yes stop_codon:yes gene_type:complete